MSEVGKRVYKTYENGIVLDGIFFPTVVAASLNPGDKIEVVDLDGQKTYVKAAPETQRPG
jgi:hypothetical protein